MAIMLFVTIRDEEVALLEEALIAWRTQQTKSKDTVSITAFADYLGASRSIVSMWMLKDRPITESYRNKIALPLANLLGPKVYEILRVEPIDSDLNRMIKIWKYIPEKIRQGFLQKGEEFVQDNMDEDDDDESPAPERNN